jgi:hypothetical protein
MRRLAKLALAVSALIGLSSCTWDEWIAGTGTAEAVIPRTAANALTEHYHAEGHEDYPYFCGYYELAKRLTVIVEDCQTEAVRRHEQAHAIAFDAGYFEHYGDPSIAPEERAADCLMQEYWGITGLYWKCPPVALANARAVLTSIGVT